MFNWRKKKKEEEQKIEIREQVPVPNIVQPEHLPHNLEVVDMSRKSIVENEEEREKDDLDLKVEHNITLKITTKSVRCRNDFLDFVEAISEEYNKERASMELYIVPVQEKQD